MNLDFSDDQKYLQEEARKFFDKENTLKSSRNILENKLHTCRYDVLVRTVFNGTDNYD